MKAPGVNDVGLRDAGETGGDDPEAHRAFAGGADGAERPVAYHLGVMNPDGPAGSVPERVTAPACVTFAAPSYADHSGDGGKVRTGAPARRPRRAAPSMVDQPLIGCLPPVGPEARYDRHATVA